MIFGVMVDLVLVVSGLALAFKGWELYVRYVQFFGFLIGFTVGALVTVPFGDGFLVILIVSLLLGGVGAWLAFEAEQFFVIGLGALAGFFAGMVYVFARFDHGQVLSYLLFFGPGQFLYHTLFEHGLFPLFVLLMAGGGYFAWRYHKLVIINSTAFFGAMLTSVGLNTFGIMLLVWPLGILVQRGVITFDSIHTMIEEQDMDIPASDRKRETDKGSFTDGRFGKHEEKETSSDGGPL